MAALALAMSGLLGLAPRADAHPVAGPQVVEPGAPVDLMLSMPVEQAPGQGPAPLVGVDVELPAAFTLTGFRAADSTWTGERIDDTVRFAGTAAFGTITRFYLSGRFTEAGVVEFPVTLRLEGGAEIVWDDPLTQYGLSHGSELHPAATIWVGVPRVIPPGGPPSDDDRSSRSSRPWVLAGGGLAIAIVIFVLGWRRRRA